MVKLAVGPAWTSPFVWTKFTESALNLQHPDGVEVRWIFGQGWSPARRHTDLCEKALAWGADFIGFLGADQVYQPDLLLRLWANVQKGYCPISAMIPTRGYLDWNKGMKPFQPMAWRFKSQNTPHATPIVYRGQHIDGDKIELVPADGTVQRIDFIGSGVFLFHRDQLLALPRPWFQEKIDPITYERHASMDTMFMWRLAWEAGCLIWCDTSIKVGHLHAFTIDETFQDRFADWATPGVGDPDIARFENIAPVVQSTHE